MPDFARYKPSERKPPRRAVKPIRKRLERSASKVLRSRSLPDSGKTRQVRGEERPLALFRKLLQDFHNGVSALRVLSKPSLGVSLPSSSEPRVVLPSQKVADFSRKDRRRSAIGSPPRRSSHISERIPKSAYGIVIQTTRRPHSLVQFKAALGSMREALPPGHRLDSGPGNRSGNLPQKGVIGSHSLPTSRARSGYHTRTLGADREAQQQILGGEYTGSLQQLPSAARLAQILRTESLIRAGEAQPSGMVFALAQAIREGRRREVADLNPEVVQGALFSSLGGPTRAKQLLNIPMTHGLITRHQIALETLQKDIRSQSARAGFLGGSTTRVRAGHARTKWASRAPEFTVPSPALVSAASHASAGAGAHSYKPPGMGAEASLREMMTVNELPHLNEVAMHERELQANGTRSEFSPHTSRGSARTKDMLHSPIGESGTRAPIAASIDAPKPQPRVQPQTHAEGRHQQSQRQQKLSGTLQLRGHNNQLLGVVELQDGEITNG